MLKNTENPERRRFIAVLLGLLANLILGVRAEGATKPTSKKIIKKQVQKSPSKSTSAPKLSTRTTPTPTPAPSKRVNPVASVNPNTKSSASPTTPPTTAKPILLRGKVLGVEDLKIGESIFANYIKDGTQINLILARQDAMNFVGFKPICTHLGGNLEFSENSLLCLRHLARFNKLTGDVESGPANNPLMTEDIQIIDSQLFVIL